jgi:hypothetical protein
MEAHLVVLMNVLAFDASCLAGAGVTVPLFGRRTYGVLQADGAPVEKITPEVTLMQAVCFKSSTVNAAQLTNQA